MNKMKLFLVAIATMICLAVSAEDKVSEYYMSYFGDKAYDIEISSIKNGKFTFYIYCESRSDDKKIGFSLESKKVDEFCNQLQSIKPKFEEWSKTARDNGVTNYDKKFETNFSSVDAFFLYGSKWCFTYGIRFKPYFKVTENGECLVVFRVGELTAASNRFMSSKGFLMVFKSSEEIDDFIKALDAQKVYNKGEKDIEKDNLFK